MVSPYSPGALIYEVLIGDSIKRDISHLCRDASPHTVRGKHTEEPEDSPILLHQLQSQSHSQTASQDKKPVISLPVSSSSHPRLPPQLYGDPNFPPAWPLLPDTDTKTGATFVDGTVGNGLGMGKGSGDGMTWGMNDESELGALSYVPFLYDCLEAHYEVAP